MLKLNGLEAKGDCATQWALADSPATGLFQSYKASESDLQSAGDLFTSFYKLTNPTSACGVQKCSLFATLPVPSFIDLSSDTDASRMALYTNVELDGTELKMKIDNSLGYELDLSFNCQTVDDTLVLSPTGQIYRKSSGKYLPDNAGANFIGTAITSLTSAQECV